MTAVAALVLVGFAVAFLASVVRDEITENFRRQRIAAEVARATSRLRRLEHDSLREMHKVAEDFLDVEGEEL